MRWVWRAERGGAALEYAVLVAVVAVIGVALVSVATPTLSGQVSTGMGSLLCNAFNLDDCEAPEGTDAADGTDPEAEPDGEDDGDPGTGDPGGDDPEEDQPETDPDEDPDGDGDGTDDDETSDIDPDVVDEFWDSQNELAASMADLEEAEDDLDGLGDDLIDLLLEITGVNDFKRCFTEGDVGSCIMVAIQVIPWGRLFKVASKIPKMWRLYDKWSTARRLRNTRRTNLDDASERGRDALESCRRGSSFPGTTPVVLATGAERPIADIAIGDYVLSTDPDTGETTAGQVIATHTDWAVRELAVVSVLGDSGAQSITATADHQFWTGAGEWREAADLTPHDVLTTPDGSPAAIVGTREYSDHAAVHNLTVADLGTFYVAAGDSGALVHNCPDAGSGSEGSTGRTTPGGKVERDALDMVQENASYGDELPVRMNDPRWPAKDGWVKMSQTVDGVEIHYVYNTTTRQADDFKFKDWINPE